MDRTLIDALDTGDYEAAIAFMTDEDDPARVLAMCHGAIRHLYWSRKDVDGAIGIGRFALGLRDGMTDPRLLGMVKSIAYDVGSFCWTGWDEPGVVIGDRVSEFGTEAAGINLALAIELDRPSAARAAAHWLVGAHHLARGASDDAVAAFEASAACARDAPDRAAELMATGYIAIARGEVPETGELSGLEDGDTYVAQLDTAARVLGIAR